MRFDNSSRTWAVVTIVVGLGICAALFAGCTASSPQADLILVNGKIITVDDNRPLVQAVAIGGDTIIAMGSNEAVSAYGDEETEVIDLQGKLAVPGFIEGHAHLLGLGRSLVRLRLGEASNFDEIVEMVREAAAAAQPGEWIKGRGWHQEKWDRPPEPNVDGLPYHYAISEAAPDNPVELTHASGHIVIANAKAMEVAGISADMADPPGGEVVRDDAGIMIGVFREDADSLLTEAYRLHEEQMTPEEREAERVRAIKAATQECLSKGITTFCDAGAKFETLDIFRKLAEENKLGMRLYAMISEENDSLVGRLENYRWAGLGDNFLTVRAIKRVFDGALGSHGAWLLEPYTDLPTTSGLNTEEIENMQIVARMAVENDFQLCTHAIGDRANRETLKIYEEAFADMPRVSDLRWRIEHAQHLDPDDIPRFEELGVIAAMQSVHATSDGPWVPKRIGDERAREGAYVWRKLIDAGAIIANGTDAPAEDVDPLACFYAAVTRRLDDGTQFYPEQCMTREEALRSYTINAAYAAFEEDIKGSITPGKLADITVLSDDIMTIDAELIPDVKVVYTIVGGKVVYGR